MNQDLLTSYNQLMTKYRELAIFSSAQGILSWDMMTKMPPKGINLRSQQLALLSGIGHRMATDPEIGQLLVRIEQDSGYQDLNHFQKRNVHLIRKSYDEQVALPENLVTEMQRQSSIANDIWRKAKASNNWEIFRPELKKNVDLTKQAASILMNVKKTSTPYDALIDIYEPGMTAEHISRLFDQLRDGLIKLLDKIERSQVKPESDLLQYKVPVDIQRKIGTALAEAVMYDISSNNAGGRIDETEHPFTSGYYDDVRITTNYHEFQFASSIFSILHEAGHALYEQDLNPDWIYQPIGSACSTGIHESQSRIVENMVGRSREFWMYFLPRLKEIAGEKLSSIDLDHFVQAINEVKPSKIRIEADEVTYSLHVIIRFNIERDLFAGKVKIEELPELWNQSYSDYLGVKIENYSEGVMQDMHWSGGNFGYFPCYALGNIYDGHYLAKMNLDIPGWSKDLERGNFSPVKDWLTKNVHSQGDLYDPPELVRRITNRELSVEPYLEYLYAKYSRLYSF
jgi:carboxypeptidase Taq